MLRTKSRSQSLESKGILQKLTIVRQARRPHSARVRVTSHVELGLARQRAADQVPICQVFGVVNLHAGVPLERGRGDVIVLPDAQDGRVGVEAWEDRVADWRHVG